MAKSNATAAHFTYVEEVDMTQLVHLRDHLKPTAERKGVKLTFLPFFAKAVLAALVEFPTLNSSVDDERGEIVVKRYYNIGIATATDEGLTVTVVHEADKKSLWDLAKEIDRLAAAARDKKLSLQDVQGSTFTITSLGKEGGILATPIINWPEVAILGVHRIEKRPVVRDDQIAIREMMYLSCSFDHRVIDGHVGAAFVQSVRNYLEHPATIFVDTGERPSPRATSGDFAQPDAERPSQRRQLSTKKTHPLRGEALRILDRLCPDHRRASMDRSSGCKTPPGIQHTRRLRCRRERSADEERRTSSRAGRLRRLR